MIRPIGAAGDFLDLDEWSRAAGDFLDLDEWSREQLVVTWSIPDGGLRGAQLRR